MLLREGGGGPGEKHEGVGEGMEGSGQEARRHERKRVVTKTRQRGQGRARVSVGEGEGREGSRIGKTRSTCFWNGPVFGSFPNVFSFMRNLRNTGSVKQQFHDPLWIYLKVGISRASISTLLLFRAEV